ncbi:MAG: LPS export ABC transporter periplasmic protein LptC [Candidatus Omnitrophica bacterium]|nr:LPS export ABC transporter periplasmic protein LptC [Candidatus Omnitrophota bacterium]
MFIIILITGAGISGCSGRAERSTSEKAAEAEAESDIEKSLQIKQEVYSFKVEGFGKGKKIQWTLEGESANVISDKINIANLKAVYYGDDMTFTIFADKAVYDKKTQDVELLDNIVGKTSDGGELSTDYARWSAKTEEISTDYYVTVTRENISCRGKGVVTKPRLKQAVFSEDVEVNISPDRRITCNGPFEIDHDKCVAIFNNNVKIADNNSQTLTDRLTVYLDPKTNKIVKVVTEGRVEIVHKGGDIENIGEITF